MTAPREVTVSDEQVDAFYVALKLLPSILEQTEGVTPEMIRRALAAFLARRVPDAMDDDDAEDSCEAFGIAWHNHCRDKVLKGV